MGWGFRKSKKIGPFRLNVGKNGVGASFGGKGFRAGVDSKGRRYTSKSLPGTGIRKREYHGAATKQEEQGAASAGCAAVCLVIGVPVLLLGFFAHWMVVAIGALFSALGLLLVLGLLSEGGGNEDTSAPQGGQQAAWASLPDHEKCEYARDLEREDKYNEAEQVYLWLAAREFEGSFPYERLAIIYRKHKDYESETQTLDYAIAIYEALEESSPRQDVPKKLERFRKRRSRAKELAS